MQILSSTFITLVFVALILWRGPDRGVTLLLMLTPFGAMAALNLPAVGGTSVMAADLALVVIAMLLLARRDGIADALAPLGPRGPGLLLAFFVLYAIIATVFFPRVFAGETQVFGIGRVANQIGIVMRPLRPDNGNLSQLLRILLGLLAFATLAGIARRRPDPGLLLRGMELATIAHVTLGILDVLSYSAGAAWLMEPLRTANYSMAVNHHMAGLKRMVGGFPEASSFGYYSLGLMGFWLSYWFSGRGDEGGRRAGIFLLLAIFVTLRSTSSSAYLGAMLFLAIFVSVQLRGAARVAGSVSRRTGAVLVFAAALVPLVVFGLYAAYELAPGFRDFVDRSLINKMDSDSGAERMNWNAQAFRNFLDTNLLGAGLGAVRASNWVIATLATTGALGLALFAGFLGRLFAMRPVSRERELCRLVSALKMGCAALLSRALVVSATPNLEIIFFAMAGLCAGLAGAAARAGARSPRRAGALRQGMAILPRGARFRG